MDLPPKHSSKKVISDTKTTAIEKPAIAFADEKPEGEKSSKTVSMFWQYIEHINNWSERVKVNLNLSLPVIFGILLIFGIGTTFIFNSNLNEVRRASNFWGFC